MVYQLLYFDEVEADVSEAKIWYKEQKEGLEIEFAAMLAKTIEKIVQRPTTYSIRYKKVRIANTKRFPFSIHFYIDEITIAVVITAIVHTKRHPKIAKNRL